MFLHTHTKQVFFEILSDPSTDSLEVTSLLLYMSSDPSPGGQGLLKALSVVTGVDLTSSEEATLSLEDLYKVKEHVTARKWFLKLF